MPPRAQKIAFAGVVEQHTWPPLCVFGALDPRDFERDESVLGRAPLEGRGEGVVWLGVVLMVVGVMGFLGKIETELCVQRSYGGTNAKPATPVTCLHHVAGLYYEGPP
ncbi:hypothetical protein C6341_g20375 [Phytophthora cactorum]|nr:hypothetical protein C6341_g20375 [Phytophthora cactorum]